MAGYTGQPRVWSLWIYDRHCTLIFHADWSYFHNRASATAAGNTTGQDAGKRSVGGGQPATLPLAEQAKLVYGLVFSLRNMTRRLSTQATPTTAASSSSTPPPTQQDSLHSFSTSTYTLAHLQTSTNYTFVMLTDPIQAPVRRAPNTTSTTSSLVSSVTSSAAATFSGGGGIPSTGGMTAQGVLQQISRGPWVEFVARNPACLSLERQPDEDLDEDEEMDLLTLAGNETQGEDEAKLRDQQRQQRRQKKAEARQVEVQRQRRTGLGKSVESEAFQAAIERVLAQNKLNAPRM